MKKPFLSKFLKQVFFALGAVVATALILELGFRLRDWRQDVAWAPPAPASGARTVLLIGDSVLGTPDSGVGRYLEADLRRRGGDAFAVRNISRPRNSSAWVNSYLSDYLRDYHPQYVILLLGKSDFSDSRLDIGEPAWLHRLKIYRLYQLAVEGAKKLVQRLERKNSKLPANVRIKILRDWYLRGRHQTVDKLVSLPVSQALKNSKKYYSHCLAMALKMREQPQLFPRAQACMRELEKSEIPPAYLSSIKSEIARGLILLERSSEAEDMLLDALHLDADNVLAQIDLGILLVSRSECGRAIPYFKSALWKVNRGVSEMCFQLYNCFVGEKREQEGEAFFSELSRSRPEICPERVATGLRGQRTGYTGYREQILVPHSLGDFMEKLYYLRQRFEASSGLQRKFFVERARLWFQSVVNFPEVQAKPMDERVFSRILQQLDRQGIKTLVLSYPDLPNKRLEELVTQMGANFRFLNLHSVVVEATKQTPLFDLLDDDFIHLTDRGHQVAAEVISQALLNFATLKP